MAGMPYHLEKGPIFSTIEALYNDPVRLRRLLHDLWVGQSPLGAHGVLTSPSADDTQNPTSANATGSKRLASMLAQWFGEVGGQPQLPWSMPNNLSTGYWSRYYGDVRRIVGETLMRAGEVALGVDRPSQPPPASASPPTGSRHWSVEFFWHCGQPRFEGWVTWREHPDELGGQVNVIFSTPATPDLVLRRPGDEATKITPATPGAWDRWQGMWVCSHEDHPQYRVITVLPTPQGQWLVPISTVLYTQGTGAIGTWAPKFGSGGSAEHPVVFQPGP